MSRRVSYPRQQYRKLFREWSRSNARLLRWLAVADLGLIAVMTASLWVMTSGDLRSYLLGVAHAVLVGLFLWVVHDGFLLNRKDAIHQLRGAWGEDNTTDVLRSARRRRRVWAWVDGVAVDGGDIDHVVATRHGGLVVMDSKWRSEIDDPAPLVRSAQRSAQRTRGLVHSVTERGRGRRRESGHDVPLVPVVVVWGPAQQIVLGHPVVDGVLFLPGRDLGRWIADLDGTPMERQFARELIERIRGFDEQRRAGLRAKVASGS